MNTTRPPARVTGRPPARGLRPAQAVTAPSGAMTPGGGPAPAGRRQVPPVNPAGPAPGSRPARARPRRGTTICAAALGVLAGVLLAVAGAGALAGVAGLAVFAICRAAFRRRRAPAAASIPAGPPGGAVTGPDLVALRRHAVALGERLAAFGHQVGWEPGADWAGSSATGTCCRCGGQVTARSDAVTGAVTVWFPGGVLLMPGRGRAVRWCGGGQ
jgi:hypothetical protein